MARSRYHARLSTGRLCTPFMPRPRSLTSWAALGVLLLSTVPAQARDGVDGEHPAKAMIDRAINLVRTDPQASNRDTQAALELLTIRPDPDLELRLADHRARCSTGDLATSRPSARAAYEPQMHRAHPQAHRYRPLRDAAQRAVRCRGRAACRSYRVAPSRRCDPPSEGKG